MSNYTLRDGQGNLWPNDRKSEDNHPDMTGKVRINGTLYSIAGWTKEGRNGTEWLSLSVREWKNRPQGAAPF